MAGELGSVGSKISCIYKIIVIPNTTSSKRPDQSYKITASDVVRSEADLLLSQPSTIATEKIDGTCVLIDLYHGKPWLWVRHDRKLNKQADKRFKKYKSDNPDVICNGEYLDVVRGFQWKVDEDFRDVPQDWRPAKGCCDEQGIPVPDSNGHIPGWVPVDPASRQHLWHLSVVDLNQGLCLVLGVLNSGSGGGNSQVSSLSVSQKINCGGEALAVGAQSTLTNVACDFETLQVSARSTCKKIGSGDKELGINVQNNMSVNVGYNVETPQVSEKSMSSNIICNGETSQVRGQSTSAYSGCSFDSLQLSVQSMSAYIGCTFELIGTSVNANPYHIGSKEIPVHFLIRHGSIPFPRPPPTGYQDLRGWFEGEREGQVEGVVWHCDQGRTLYKIHRHHMGLQWPLVTPRLSTLPVSVKVELGNKNSNVGLLERFSHMSGKTFESLKKLTLT